MSGAPGRSGHLLRAAPTLLRVAWAEMLVYRAEVVIWFLTATLPLIMMFVWDRVAEDGAVAGYDRPALAAYFAATLVVRQLAGCWVVWALNESIRHGQLSAALLKPMHPITFMAAENLGDKPLRVVVLVPLVLAIWAWRPDMQWAPGPLAAALVVPSVLLAWLLNFAVQVVFGSLAFHLQRSLGLFQVWFGLFALFSGYLFPLDLLPARAREVVRALPFQAMLATPVELLTGRLAGAAALWAVAHQVLWLAVGVGVAALAWRTGVRRYEAYGA